MTYVVTYAEVDPASTTQAIRLLAEYRENCRIADGNAGVHVVQEAARPNRFVIIEAWRDEAGFHLHESAPHTTLFRSWLGSIHLSPYDQRVHQPFAVVPESQPDRRDGLWVVTHVDVPPPRREETEVLLRRLAEESRTEEWNVRYDVFQQNAPRTNHFTVLAVWNDEKAFALHATRPYTRRFREALGPLLGAPYDERLYKHS